MCGCSLLTYRDPGILAGRSGGSSLVLAVLVLAAAITPPAAAAGLNLTPAEVDLSLLCGSIPDYNAVAGCRGG